MTISSLIKIKVGKTIKEQTTKKKIRIYSFDHKMGIKAEKLVLKSLKLNLKKLVGIRIYAHLYRLYIGHGHLNSCLRVWMLLQMNTSGYKYKKINKPSVFLKERLILGSSGGHIRKGKDPGLFNGSYSCIRTDDCRRSSHVPVMEMKIRVELFISDWADSAKILIKKDI